MGAISTKEFENQLNAIRGSTGGLYVGGIVLANNHIYLPLCGALRSLVVPAGALLVEIALGWSR